MSQRLVQQQPGGIDIRSIQNRSHMGIELFLQRFRRGIQDVSHEVGLAPLPGDPLEVLTNGLDQSAMVIRDYHVHATQVHGFSARKKFAPTGFRFAVAQHQTQNFTITVGIDTDTPIITPRERTRPSSRIFSTKASTRTKGKRLSRKSVRSKRSQWGPDACTTRKPWIWKTPYHTVLP